MQIIKAHQDKYITDLKTNACLIYRLAELVATGVNNPKKFPKSSEEAFPLAFKDNSKKSWQDHKAMMMQHAKPQ